MLGEGAWRNIYSGGFCKNKLYSQLWIPAAAIEQPVELLIRPTWQNWQTCPKEDFDARSLVPLMKNPDMQWTFRSSPHLDESNGGWQSKDGEVSISNI